jgi:hypothetical protein
MTKNKGRNKYGISSKKEYKIAPNLREDWSVGPPTKGIHKLPFESSGKKLGLHEKVAMQGTLLGIAEHTRCARASTPSNSYISRE